MAGAGPSSFWYTSQMLKLLLLLAVVGAVLVMGGVLEVKVHPERFSQVPGAVVAYVSQPSTQAQARVLFTNLKRRGEQLIIKDEEKKTKLALLYVSQDAARLEEILGSADADTLLPQAELLADSIKRVKDQLDAASLETVGALKDDSREAISAAEKTFQLLQGEHARYQAVQEKFATITSAIGDSLAALRPNSTGGVAGTQDNAPESTNTDEPQINAVPLNF